MRLRDSIDDPSQGTPYETPLNAREVWYYASAFVDGYSQGSGLRIAATTNGPEMRLHDLANDTQSPLIVRPKESTTREMWTMLIAHLDARLFWEPESDTWGPDPWREEES